MPEIDDIKAEHMAALRRRRLVIIAYADYGYHVHEWTPDSVYPHTAYDTPQEAGARALQPDRRDRTG